MAAPSDPTTYFSPWPNSMRRLSQEKRKEKKKKKRRGEKKGEIHAHNGFPRPDPGRIRRRKPFAEFRDRLASSPSEKRKKKEKREERKDLRQKGEVCAA